MSLPLKQLTKKIQTPFYVYDLDRIESQVSVLREALPLHTDIHYAMKANANPLVLKHLKSLGTGVDTVSGGEIKRALDCGFRGRQILFSGVGKTVDELNLAIKIGIKLINVESPQELERLGRLAQRRKKNVAVGFRLNPNVAAGSHPYISTGAHTNKFGMSFSALPELKRILKKFPRLELQAVDFHIGSQLLKLGPLERAISRTVPVFKSLRSEGFPLRYFDIGGGLGIKYKDEKTIDLKAYGAIVQKNLGPLDVTILTEPGRFIVGESGVLVTQVQYIKKAPSKTFAIVDTGMHHLLRPALYGAFHKIAALKPNSGRSKTYEIVGPICESSDVLGERRRLPELKQGDYLAIENAGAYGYSMASDYNLKGLPTEVVVSRGRPRISPRPRA
jgi:diaminopimelate decarboxylase